MTHNKLHVDDKKLLMRKICQLHFASSINSLILILIILIIIYYSYYSYYIILVILLYNSLILIILIISHNCQEKFLSQWGLLINWWNGARRLSTVEKEEASTFQAADLATTVPLTCSQNYIASNTNHCFKSFGKNISFLLYWIHKVKM